MRSVVAAALTILIAGASAQAEEREPAPYFIQFDKDLSMISGAENEVTLHRLLQIADDRAIDLPDFENRRWLGIGVRGAKAVFLDIPVAYWLMLAQHEVFGHGSRCREFDYGNVGFKLSAPPPYGSGEGLTSCAIPIDATQQELIGIGAAGMEATGVLAHRLAFKWLESGEIDHRETWLYAGAFHDATLYIRRGSGTDDVLIGDPERYAAMVNAYYGQNVLELSDLRDRALVNYLDSFSWLAGWTEARYLFTGKDRLALPMIHSGPVRWLPGLRLGLTPFGTEYVFNGYFVHRMQRPGHAYFRFGDDGGQSYYGVGIETRSVWRTVRLRVDLKLDLWRQPELNVSAAEADMELGAGATMRAQVKLARKYGLIVAIGGKTKGFVTGEPFDGQLIVRVGLALLDL